MPAWSNFRESLGFGPSKGVVAERAISESGVAMERAQQYGRDAMMAALSIAIEDRGWINTDQWSRDGSTAHLTFEAIQKAAGAGRALVQANPIMQRASHAVVDYIFGDGIRITGGGRLITKPQNRRNVFDVEALQRLHLARITDGNILFLLGDDGVIETIPFYEISGAVYSRRDTSIIEYFQRTWTQITYVDGQPKPVTRKMLYRNSTLDTPRESDWEIDYGPDFDYEYPLVTPRRIDDVEIYTDGVIKHVAANRLEGAAWGVPDLLAGIFYASEHKELVEAGDSVWRAQSQYAVNYKGKTKKQVEDIAAKVAGPAPLGPDGKPQQYGGTNVMGSDIEMQLMQKIGAGIDFANFDPIAGLATTALGIPLDTVLGKEKPDTMLPYTTKRRMKLQQEFWKESFRDIFEFYGKRAAKVYFSKLDPDPTHRQMQTIAGIAALEIARRTEIRQLVIDTLGADWDPEDLPDADEWASLRKVAPGSTEVGGPITPGQGQTGRVGRLNDGDHELRDEGLQDHTRN